MNLLAFDTGTETMSIAVGRTVDGVARQWLHSSTGGAQASSRLIPTILDLLQQADLRLDALHAICFGSGPGSFTGLRTACSVAQGLAFGAGVMVLPVDSLLAVAEDARHTHWGDQASGVVTALLDARMDEMYAATYAYEGTQWRTLQGSHLLAPQALQRLPHTPLPWALAGNVFAVYAARVAEQDPAGADALRCAASPTAAAMLRLAPQLLAAGAAVDAAQALPHYIRDKVAKTTAERMAEKAAALAAKLDTRCEARFEPMTPEHVPAVLHVEQSAYAHPWNHTNFVDALQSGYQAQMLLAGETLLGYFVAMKGVEEVHLLNITVAPEYQRQGWARVMLDALTLWARGQCAHWLWLEVRVGNVRAEQVYRAHGYQMVGRRKAYYPAVNGLREDALVLGLRLQNPDNHTP